MAGKVGRVQAISFWDQRGSSLLEVVIASAIGVVILLSTVAMQENGAKQNQLLMQKLTILDTGRAVTQVLANSVACNLMFANSNLVNASSLTFDSTQVSSTNPHYIDMTTIPSSSNGSALVTVGADMGGGMQVSSIRLAVTSAQPLGGKLSVHFTQPAGMMQMKDLQFSMNLASTGAPNNKTVTGCGLPTALSSLGSCQPGQFVSGFSSTDGSLICSQGSGGTNPTNCMTTAMDGSYQSCCHGGGGRCSPVAGGQVCGPHESSVCVSMFCTCGS